MEEWIEDAWEDGAGDGHSSDGNVSLLIDSGF
jgi:hypothetical protein